MPAVPVHADLGTQALDWFLPSRPCNPQATQETPWGVGARDSGLPREAPSLGALGFAGSAHPGGERWVQVLGCEQAEHVQTKGGGKMGRMWRETRSRSG